MPPTSLELSTLGHRIRHQRLAHGYTLDELGAVVGVAGSQLSLIENGKREPKLSLLHPKSLKNKHFFGQRSCSAVRHL